MTSWGLLQPYLRDAGVALAVVLVLIVAMLLRVGLLRRAVASRTRELRAEEGMLRALFDAIPDAIWVKDLDGIYRECNDRLCGSFKVDRNALIGHGDEALFTPEIAAKVRATDALTLRRGERYTYLLPLTTSDGVTRHFEIVKMPMHAADGALSGIVGVARDITERRQTDRELRLAAVAFQTHEASVVTDPDGVIQRVNAAFVTLTGYRSDEACGQSLALLIPQQENRSPYLHAMEQARAAGFWQGELWVRMREGQPRVVRATVSAVPDDTGRVGHYVGAMIDLTTEHEARASIDRVTFFDPLTELPNRNFLLRRLQHALADADLRGGALLLIDLDHLRRVNDLRGHAAGDRLLGMIAQRLRPLLDEPAVLCRFRGGTFALLVPCDPLDPAAPCVHASAHAGRIRHALREPFPLEAVEGSSVKITVSVGWTDLNRGRQSAESALEEAELAMYSAKASGRDQVRRFEPEMRTALQRREALAHDLARAIAGEAGCLDLHLQLQADRHGRAIGAEALLRWTRPDGERVSPGLFVSIAEERGLIVALGNWVLHSACTRLADWSTRPLTRGLSLSVNVSARQFAQHDFVERLRGTLDETGADPGRLKLEITETVILGDLDEIADALKRLRTLGIRISLDDFGIGYSSLSYLARLPLDQLKIDRSFISRLHEDTNNATIAQTIIGMGRELGLEVIAEGVETAAQHQLLMAYGCDAFQGYLLSRPLPPAAFEEMLAERSRLDGSAIGR